MAKPLAVPPIPGVEDLTGLLHFLADPEAYAARVRVLEAHAETIRALIAQVAAADELDALRAQARADRQMTAETLVAAKAEAVKIRGTALEERDAAVAEAARARQTVEQERAVLDREIAQAAKAASERDAHLVTREQGAAVLRDAADAALRETQALKAELVARLAKLRAAADAAVA